MFLFKDGSHIQLWCWGPQPSRLCCPWKKGLWRKNTFLKEGSTKLKCAATIEKTPRLRHTIIPTKMILPHLKYQAALDQPSLRFWAALGLAGHKEPLALPIIARELWSLNMRCEHRHIEFNDHRMSSMSLDPSTDWMRPNFKKWGPPAPAGR